MQIEPRPEANSSSPAVADMDVEMKSTKLPRSHDQEEVGKCNDRE